MEINCCKYQTATANTCNLFIYIFYSLHVVAYTFFTNILKWPAVQFRRCLFMIARRQRHVRFMNVIQRSSLPRQIYTIYMKIYKNIYATENKHEQSAIWCNFSLESPVFRHPFSRLYAFEV